MWSTCGKTVCLKIPMLRAPAPAILVSSGPSFPFSVRFGCFLKITKRPDVRNHQLPIHRQHAYIYVEGYAAHVLWYPDFRPSPLPILEIIHLLPSECRLIVTGSKSLDLCHAFQNYVCLKWKQNISFDQRIPARSCRPGWPAEAWHELLKYWL